MKDPSPVSPPGLSDLAPRSRGRLSPGRLLNSFSPRPQPLDLGRANSPPPGPIFEGLRVWIACYFLSTRTIRSRSGATAPFKYLAKNSSTRDRVKVLVSRARSNALSSGFKSRVNLLETRPA